MVVALFSYTFISCTEEIETINEKVYPPAAIGQPVEFEFSLGDADGQTRSTTPLPVNETVYVTPDKGTTYYLYQYDDLEERWKCAGTPTDHSKILTWTATNMNLWAFVGNNGFGAPNIEADQANEGFEDSDFLGSFGTYTYTTGVVRMTLEHKVARLVVKVTGSLDPSMLTCTTNSAFPTSANISLGESSVSLTAGATTAAFKLYRSTFTKDNSNAANNTTYFTAYLMPNESFSTAFTLKCATLTYTSSTILVPLRAGKTSQVNIALPVIQSVWNYDITTPGRADELWVPSVYDNAYAADNTISSLSAAQLAANYYNVGPIATGSPNIGTAQPFEAPITGWYRLEVWGAEGGSYQYTKPGLEWSDYDLQMKGISMCKGGTGAYVTGKVKLDKGTKLYVYVGKAGIQDVDYAAYNSSEGYYAYKFAGGWNGGGAVWMSRNKNVRISRLQEDLGKDANNKDLNYGVRELGGGGGGGATDIALQSANWETDAHLYSRIIVAGGGGGGCYTPDQAGWYNGGGGGGGSTWAGVQGDGDTTCPGRGGTLTEAPTGIGAGSARSSNYCKFSYNGSFGYGGGCGWSGEAMGGGGGGWYGGAPGTGGGTNAAGGGGSSYAYTAELLYPGTSNTIASYYPNTYAGQTGYMPNTKYLLTEVSNLSGSYVQTVTAEEWPTTTIVGARSAAWEGHGHARITLLLE